MIMLLKKFKNYGYNIYFACKENKIPIIVFSILQKDALTEIINGKGSLI